MGTIKNFGEIIVEGEEKEKIDYNLYNDFEIQLKEPIYKLINHTDYVLRLALMKDGRLVSGSGRLITIYNKESYKSDLIIKEHQDRVLSVIQLRTGILASSSDDKTIKLFKINGINYEIIQTLNYHTDSVRKVIEIENKTLVSCSKDTSIIFYKKNNLEYIKDYCISTEGPCTSIIQATNDEICYSTKNAIGFFDILAKKKYIIDNISISDQSNGRRVWLTKINNELLIVPGVSKISIVNINEHKLVRVIDNLDSSDIQGICKLKKNMFLTGDIKNVLRQWKIEGDNLILISKKEKAHSSMINVLLNLGDGHIASGSDDRSIKIW